MSLSTSEIEALRFHLGYGNVSVGAYPYTRDGFLEIFSQVIAPNLTTDTETTATLPVTIIAGSTPSLTLVSVVNIVPYTRLVLDVGDDVEVVQVKSVVGSVVTLKCTLPHTTPMPVSILSGTARLRLLMHAADRALAAETGADVLGNAGIKILGKGEIEYFPGAVLADVSGQYANIQQRIASLVRVPVAGSSSRSGRTQLEVY